MSTGIPCGGGAIELKNASSHPVVRVTSLGMPLALSSHATLLTNRLGINAGAGFVSCFRSASLGSSGSNARHRPSPSSQIIRISPGRNSFLKNTRPACIRSRPTSQQRRSVPSPTGQYLPNGSCPVTHRATSTQAASVFPDRFDPRMIRCRAVLRWNGNCGAVGVYSRRASVCRFRSSIAARRTFAARRRSTQLP